jgi:hypothetical protein
VVTFLLDVVSLLRGLKDTDATGGERSSAFEEAAKAEQAAASFALAS